MNSTDKWQSEIQKLSKTLLEMPWDNQEFYKNWLAQSHYYTHYSTRLLAFAAGWTTGDKQTYYRRSLQHIKEEQGHDLIATNDLKKLGGSLESYPELGVTRALWEAQFYKTQRNPTHLLGYILALEMLAVSCFRALHEKIEKSYTADACVFVKVHADDDPDHVEEALEQIHRCNPEEIREIAKNFTQTCEVYGLMLKSLKDLS